MVVEIIYRDYKSCEFPNMDEWDARDEINDIVFHEYGDDADYEIKRIDEWEEDEESGTDIDIVVTIDKIYDICARNESMATEQALELFRDEFGDYDETTITVICY
jgi:hypothetical protein